MPSRCPRRARARLPFTLPLPFRVFLCAHSRVLPRCCVGWTRGGEATWRAPRLLGDAGLTPPCEGDGAGTGAGCRVRVFTSVTVCLAAKTRSCRRQTSNLFDIHTNARTRTQRKPDRRDRSLFVCFRLLLRRLFSSHFVLHISLFRLLSRVASTLSSLLLPHVRVCVCVWFVVMQPVRFSS